MENKENKGLAKTMFNEWLGTVGLTAEEVRKCEMIKHPELEEMSNLAENYVGFDSFIDFCMCKAVSLYLKKFGN